MPDTYTRRRYVDVTSATPAHYWLVGVFPVFGVRLHGTVPVSQVHSTSSLIIFGEGVKYGNHVTFAQRSTPALVALQPPNPRQVTPKLQP
jgi:hypothetical protein